MCTCPRGQSLQPSDLWVQDRGESFARTGLHKPFSCSSDGCVAGFPAPKELPLVCVHASGSVLLQCCHEHSHLFLPRRSLQRWARHWPTRHTSGEIGISFNMGQGPYLGNPDQGATVEASDNALARTDRPSSLERYLRASGGIRVEYDACRCPREILIREENVGRGRRWTAVLDTFRVRPRRPTRTLILHAHARAAPRLWVSLGSPTHPPRFGISCVLAPTHTRRTQHRAAQPSRVSTGRAHTLRYVSALSSVAVYLSRSGTLRIRCVYALGPPRRV
jgi:hypothetical protein